MKPDQLADLRLTHLFLSDPVLVVFLYLAAPAFQA